MNANALDYPAVWVVDFEYCGSPGERPSPICLVALELRSQQLLRFWLHGGADVRLPFSPGSLLVAYFACAEMGCFISLGWSADFDIVDLYAEFRCLTNGELVDGAGLLDAIGYFFGVDAATRMAKDAAQRLAMRGGPFSSDEQQVLLEYCESDVRGTARLLPAILAGLTEEDFSLALLRGRYMRTVAAMESFGIPIDTVILRELQSNWAALKARLVASVDENYGVYEDGHFVEKRWRSWVTSKGIWWPHGPSGLLMLDDATFKQIGRIHPQVETMRQLRHALSQLRLSDLSVGRDGRARALISPFRSKTGRNQPSTSKFAFGTAVWTRHLIRAEPGFALAYVDWANQEFGIGAYLSGDRNMIAAYESACPYLKFAELAGAVPEGATKQSHPEVRERFKNCALAVQFGQGAMGLAQRLGCTVAEAQHLLETHRKLFSVYWSWSDAALRHAVQSGRLVTTFGWRFHLARDVNPRSVRNFPLQANAAEMLRIACIGAVETGVEVCAPVHDAILIHAPTEVIEEQIARLHYAMAEASRLVLAGPTLRVSTEVFRYPASFSDKRGSTMWQMVNRLLFQE